MVINGRGSLDDAAMRASEPALYGCRETGFRPFLSRLDENNRIKGLTAAFFASLMLHGLILLPLCKNLRKGDAPQVSQEQSLTVKLLPDLPESPRTVHVVAPLSISSPQSQAPTTAQSASLSPEVEDAFKASLKETAKFKTPAQSKAAAEEKTLGRPPHKSRSAVSHLKTMAAEKTKQLVPKLKNKKSREQQDTTIKNQSSILVNRESLFQDSVPNAEQDDVAENGNSASSPKDLKFSGSSGEESIKAAVPGKEASGSDRFIKGNEIRGDREPICVHRARPKYPDLARQKGWEGTVLIEAVVSQTGVVSKTSVIRGSGYAILDQAAREAVGEWRFRPRTNDNTSTWVRIPVTFQLQ